MLNRWKDAVSEAARARRAETFRRLLAPRPEDRILDLGGGDGSHIALAAPGHKNVTVADVLPEQLERARADYGYDTVLLDIDGDGRLPFADQAFDIVWCSSVIEHATGPKAQMIAMDDDAEFERVAADHQSRFAAEIRRVAKRYWVQTPYRHFVIEAHSWLPIAVDWLPRKAKRTVLRGVAPFWIADVQPDWRLLSKRQMQELFPEARIVEERAGGLVKSIVAVGGIDAATA